jgi:hypothetical protein
MVIIKKPTSQKDLRHKALTNKITKFKKITTEIYRLIKHLTPFIPLILQTIDDPHKAKASTPTAIIHQINDLKKASVRKGYSITS